MRLVADSGLWSTDIVAVPAPLVAVLEVSGAVLSWTVDAPADVVPEITFTDHRQADWLWRVIGESAHVELVAALDRHGVDGPVELAGGTFLPGVTETLRRLAFGYWLRRWWPASARDGIVALDPALLDAELAVLTVAAEDFFTDDTFDSDVSGLLVPHLVALKGLAELGDPRVVELVEACRELAGDIGLQWPEVQAAAPRRADYALAAGAADGPTVAGPIATGRSTVPWSSVPPAIFDTAENTVEWAVAAAGDTVTIAVQVAVSGPGRATGIEVALRCGPWRAAGVLDAEGRTTLRPVDARDTAISQAQAWNTDWSAAEVTVGAGAGESAQIRDRVRALARARLANPAGDAFLAEVLAAEDDY